MHVAEPARERPTVSIIHNIRTPDIQLREVLARDII
jgi:hypothetical protein